MSADGKTPLFINPHSGSASQVLEQLQNDPRIEVNALPASEMACAIQQRIRQGAPRILVAGGDGTLALAAARLAGTNTALGVIPGGTLNHFASRHNIPTDPQEALELALGGVPQPVDAGYVNDQLFLNTSSVGAYVHFVRTREHLEQRMNYHLASLLAGMRRLLRLRSAYIQMNRQTIHTPLVFIGVEERQLEFPVLGQTRENGASGLHLIAIKTRYPLESLKMALNALFRGIDPLTKARQVEHAILESVELTYRRRKRRVYVAVDGELTLLQAPLYYQYVPEALLVIQGRAKSLKRRTCLF